MLEYTAEALADLGEIWDRNAKQVGVQHADQYIAFLKAGTFKLMRSSDPGHPVPGRENYRYAVIKRRRSGYCHLAVFTIDGEIFRVYRYFHSSQNWKTKVADEFRLEDKPES